MLVEPVPGLPSSPLFRLMDSVILGAELHHAEDISKMRENGYGCGVEYHADIFPIVTQLTEHMM